MDFNLSFWAGLGCGVCLGISVVALRKYFSIPQRFMSSRGSDSTTKSSHSLTSEPKVVLVVRTDLNMSKGKIAAQCGHAAVGVFEKAMKQDPALLKLWQWHGQAKVALKVDNVEEMMEIKNNANKLGLITSVIRDAGRTQIAPNSITVLGVGPGPKDVIDKVTGHLKLL